MTTSLIGLRRSWIDLPPAALDTLVGDQEASFVAPLKQIAPLGLGLIGLPRWYGKRFRARHDGALSGVNLLRAGRGASNALQETMPMVVREGISLLDGRPAVVIEYAPGTRRPWPWVRDELRQLPDGSLVGMTIVDLPVLRLLGGTPFLLHRRT